MNWYKLTNKFTAGFPVFSLMFTFAATPAFAASTDVIIIEIMQNPASVADSAGEWFELYNTGDTAVDIDGWTVQDNNLDSLTINNGGPLPVPAGGYLVLGNNADIFLANGADELVLLDAGQGHSLVSKLENILAKLAKGKNKAAINQLGVFVKKRILTAQQGERLINAASVTVDNGSASNEWYFEIQTETYLASTTYRHTKLIG